MKLEAIDFLSILSGAESLAILNKDIDATLLDEKFEVQSGVALSDRSIMKHCLTLAIPLRQVHLMRFAGFAMSPKNLHGIELSVLDGKVNSCLPSLLIFDIWVGFIS